MSDTEKTTLQVCVCVCVFPWAYADSLYVWLAACKLVLAHYY
jgi:hypothetical protein